ncbi:MAG: hypothetical protein QOG04_679 [Actinomycetota bacterium]|jgi:hypothetical protein|nr:hypothetical protein [Actinomycetota bacterium]
MSLLVVVLAFNAHAGSNKVEFSATQQRFLDSDDVDVNLVNNTDDKIEMFGGSIRSLRSDQRMVKLTPKERFLQPGSVHSWTWSTQDRVGRFEARFRTSAGTLTDTFEKGAYFTLGFDQSNDSFVIWVRERQPIRKLRADLGKAQDERRIVSGIVSRSGNYNPEWSYTMGPGSIVLGDVFTEVCDGTPLYVENHRRQWMGDRWCPWSSYVASEGRR